MDDSNLISRLLQFLFIEGADIPTLGDRPFKLKETLRTVSPTGTLITTTKTTFANGGESFLFSSNSQNIYRLSTKFMNKTNTDIAVDIILREKSFDSFLNQAMWVYTKTLVYYVLQKV